MSNVRDWFARYWSWKLFISLLLLPVVGNIFSTELRELLYAWFGWKKAESPFLGQTTLVSGILFAGLVAMAVRFGRELLRPKNIALGPKAVPDPLPHLVLFLSNIRPDPKRFRDDMTPAWLDLPDTLAAAFDTLVQHKPNNTWAWEMPLRAAYHHRTALRSVTLVCSQESRPQAQLFAVLLTKKYQADFPHLKADAIRLLAREGTGVKLLPCAGGVATTSTADWGFEEYDELYDGLTQMMDVLVKEGVREREVVVDVTGGQKPNSIVGALLTVNRRTQFQYVQTGNTNEVIAYDLVTDATG